MSLAPGNTWSHEMGKTFGTSCQCVVTCGCTLFAVKIYQRYNSILTCRYCKHVAWWVDFVKPNLCTCLVAPVRWVDCGAVMAIQGVCVRPMASAWSWRPFRYIISHDCWSNIAARGRVGYVRCGMRYVGCGMGCEGALPCDMLYVWLLHWYKRACAHTSFEFSLSRKNAYWIDT